jgi:hypothetical protein
MQPVVNRLDDEFGDRIQVIPLDANHDGREAFRAGGFKGHPAYVLLRTDGEEAWRGLGIIDYATLVDVVQLVLES